MEEFTYRKLRVYQQSKKLVLVIYDLLKYFPKEEKRNSEAVIRIGAGDDMSGILMEEVVAQMDGEYMVSDTVESSSFQDC
jgi:hypothetical protein